MSTPKTAAGGPLGRREPTSFEHVEKYPLRKLIRSGALPVPERVEKTLFLPNRYRDIYDQTVRPNAAGHYGTCVAFAASRAMTILNGRQYDPIPLYDATQLRDEWNDTPPEEGTSVSAACDVLRDVGHWGRRYKKTTTSPIRGEGIEENRWAETVDESRACIAAGIPVITGFIWHRAFSMPEKVGNDYYIGRNLSSLGPIDGGHATCVYAASDRRGAFKLDLNWGRAYPLVWMTYETYEYCLRRAGEATIITDRI